MVNSLSQSTPYAQRTNPLLSRVGTLNSQNLAQTVAVVPNPPRTAQSSTIETIFKAIVLILAIALVYYSQKNKNNGASGQGGSRNNSRYNPSFASSSTNGNLNFWGNGGASSSYLSSSSSSNASKVDDARQKLRANDLDGAFDAAKKLDKYSFDGKRDQVLAEIAEAYITRMTEESLGKAETVISEISFGDFSSVKPPIYKKLFLAYFNSNLLDKAQSVLKECDVLEKEELRKLLINKLIGFQQFEMALEEAKTFGYMANDEEFIRIGNGFLGTQNWLKAVEAYSKVLLKKNIVILKAKSIISQCQNDVNKEARNAALKLFVDCCLHANPHYNPKNLMISVRLSSALDSWIVAECDQKGPFSETDLSQIEASIINPALFGAFAQELQRLSNQNRTPSVAFNRASGFSAS